MRLEDDFSVNWTNVSVTLVKMISTLNDPHLLGTATGFFFKTYGAKFLVTNRHIVIDEEANHFPDKLVIKVHTSRTEVAGSREIELNLYDDHRHPLWLEVGPKIDVAILEIGELLLGTDVVEFWEQGHLLQKDVLIDEGGEVVVSGYPEGLYDHSHYLPISRNGTVASPFGADFNENHAFLIDAKLHEGTSGSPVYLPISTTQFKNVTNDTVELQKSYFNEILLGVNSGPWLHGPELHDLDLHVVWYADLLTEILNKSKPSLD